MAKNLPCSFVRLMGDPSIGTSLEVTTAANRPPSSLPARFDKSTLQAAIAIAFFLTAGTSCTDRKNVDIAAELLARPTIEQLPPLVDLREVGIYSELGGREESDASATLQRPVDAVISDHEVLVLEQSPPWVRVFSRDGRFLRTLVDFTGDTLLDIGRPLSLRGRSGGGFVINDWSILRSYDSLGHVQARTELLGMRLRGGTEACGGKVYLIGFGSGVGALGFVGRMNFAKQHIDTILQLDTLRRNSPAYYPPAILGSANGLVLFSDEIHDPRILRISCDGTLLSSFDVTGLGADQESGMTERNSKQVFYIKPPTPPLPSGLGVLGDHVLWAVRLKTRATSKGFSDTLITVLTEIDKNGVARRISLRGWLQLFGGDGDSTLIFGAGFGNGRRLPIQPKVLVVDGRALQRVIDSIGTRPIH